MKRSDRVAVIGAGWSGLAAAVTLAKAGCAVTVFDSAREPGGRARALDWNEAGLSQRIDNGQHILIGAYRATLDLMAEIKGDAEVGLRRERLTLTDSRGLWMRAWPLAAPMHLAMALLFARGLSFRSRLAMVRLIESARSKDWKLTEDTNVLAWLQAAGQPPQLVQRIWLPLCVAALNTPAAIASAQTFLHVLRDSLGASRRASDLLLPMTSLDAALPHPAIEYLKRHGANVMLGTAVQAVVPRDDGCAIHSRTGAELFDAAVLAVPAHQVPHLTAQILGEPWDLLRRQCQAFTWQPIATCYLVYQDAIKLKAPMQALDEDSAAQRFGQWLFARGQLGGRADTLAVVVSASGPHMELPQAELARLIDLQLRHELGLKPNLLGSRVITEKRATFAAVPGLARPPAETASAHLVLAGDYTESDYPATLESAVLSGRRAARLLLERAAP